MATLELFPAPVSGEPHGDFYGGLDPRAQEHIRRTFWPGSNTSLSEYASYFRYFQWTISVLLWPNIGSAKAQFMVQKNEDLATVVSYLDAYRHENRATIANRHSMFPETSEDRIMRSMDLAVRLWMTLHVRSGGYPIGPLSPDMTSVEWRRKQSLSNMVASAFPKCRSDTVLPAFREARIDPGFTVMNLRKICRIQVEWTPNLKDHLRFDHSTKRLYIYPHKVCLLNHLEHCNVYPKGFLRETIRTLDLLFPYGDSSTESWLEASKQPFHRTSSSYVQARASNLAEFCYWRRQLVELYDVFQQPPSTIFQMWHDRRNPMQWYTFWLAAFIAISSTVFGVIGCYIGFKQIDIAERSIQLAFSQTNPSDKLSR